MNAVFWDMAPCRYYVNRRFGPTSQKTALFIVTAVKTSNLTGTNYSKSEAVGSCSYLSARPGLDRHLRGNGCYQIVHNSAVRLLI
jgi:hypothetical protein